MADLIIVERQDQILTITINRPDKRNALNAEMFRALAAAYTQLCDTPELRCGILRATGEMFCAGLDLMDMAPALMGGDGPALVGDGEVDPFNWGSVGGRQGRRRTKPMVTAVHGRCYTAGIELALSTDIVVAEKDCRFAQAEVRRGLIPLGGAIARFTGRFGRGDAMRWLLTGDEFDAAEAHRIGLVQEVAPRGEGFALAMAIAERICSAAPLGVQETLANANVALERGEAEAAEALRQQMLDRISGSTDLQEGIASLMQKREPVFRGE